MPDPCDQFRDEMARQTPVFDRMFLKTYIPMETDMLGRHETGAWEMGTGDTHFVDRLYSQIRLPMVMMFLHPLYHLILLEKLWWKQSLQPQ